jgi:hypothetical protein
LCKVRNKPNEHQKAAPGEDYMQFNRKGTFAIASAMLALFVLCCALRAQDSGTTQNISSTISTNFIHDTGQSLDLPDPFQPGSVVPHWRSGVLIQPGGGFPDSSFTLYDRTGNQRKLEVTIPGSEVVSIHDVDLDKAGNIYLSGAADDSDGRHVFFIARISKADGKTTVVRTGIYSASHICVNSEGNIWTLGRRLDQTSANPAYPTLRLYSFEKGRLQGYLPNTSVIFRNKDGHYRTPFGPGIQFNETIQGISPQIAFCTDSTVEVYSPETDEWIHLDVATGNLDRWKIDSSAIASKGIQRSYGFAYLPAKSVTEGSGTAYLVTAASASPRRSLFVLRLIGDRLSWQDVSVQAGMNQPARISHIYGSDGQSLVHEARGDRLMHWSRPEPNELDKVKDSATPQ